MDQTSSHIIIFDSANRVLVVKRSPNDEWGAGLFAIPGGRREKGESLLQNITRETQEEVGLTLVPNKIKFLTNVSNKLNHCFFTTRHFNGQAALGDDEHTELKWVNPRELKKEECVPNLQEEIREAQKIMCKNITIRVGNGVKSEDKLPGGLGDNAKPSDFDKNQVKMGLKVEMEHTNDPHVAIEIVLDHLSEEPKYYDKLKTIEKD